MPPNGSAARGEALAELSVLQHHILTDKKVATLLQAAAQEDLNDIERSNSSYFCRGLRPRLIAVQKTLYMPLHADTNDSLNVFIDAPIVHLNGPTAGLTNKFEDVEMNKVLALTVAALMGLSSAAFAAETTAAPAPGATSTHTTHATTTQHIKQSKAASEQKAKTRMKHEEVNTNEANVAKPAVTEEKAQAAKKHHKTVTKPAVKPAA